MTAIQPVPGPAESEAGQSQRLEDPDAAKEEAYAFERALDHDVPRIYMTPALIAANVLVYAVMCLNGVDFWEPGGVHLLVWGANYGPLTQFQWWRLVTSTFVHAGLLHVSLNMWALWASGHIVERLYGPRWFVLLYMLSGVGASLVSLWHHPGVPSVGASGAIVGVYGCLLAFMLHPCKALSNPARNVEIKSLLSFFCYLLLSGFQHSGIDTAAHIGGALIGFVIGSIYVTWLEPHLPHVAAAISAHRRARSDRDGSPVQESPGK